MLYTTKTVYLCLQRFEVLLLETDSKPQISMVLNIQFLLYYYKRSKLTFDWSHNFLCFFVYNRDSIIVNLKLVKIIDFSAAL